MVEKWKTYLGFPYPKEYKVGFYQDLMKRMYKPLLIVVTAILLFVTWLVGICIFYPESIAPAKYIDGLLAIHMVFLVFTIVVLMVSVGFRRQFFIHPQWNIALCNAYAIGVCLWASVLSAYASYSAAVYSAFIFVMLCTAMVSLFPPWLAALTYSLNYGIYLVLLGVFSSDVGQALLIQAYNSGLAAVVGLIIAVAFYRFRARTYYDKVIIERQIAEIHKINSRLQQLVHMDNLTGMYNRRYYDEVLPDELKKLHANGHICCMMFDVDYFKKYNDQYGHPAGDEALRLVAAMIMEDLRPRISYVIRYGGEEIFALASVASTQEAMVICEGIRRRVEEAYISHKDSPHGRLTLSCGLVFCPADQACDLRALVKQADEALYQSKQRGRNRVTLYGDEDADA
ncbi:diguanylate cyclase [Eubacteriales bacterium OttesenSCG-928-M02]|nr:diguanylate cyclase [Eubacteriales bacterium OttesenSCG-928-M02]